jgi:hypothetical protein
MDGPVDTTGRPAELPERPKAELSAKRLYSAIVAPAPHHFPLSPAMMTIAVGLSIIRMKKSELSYDNFKKTYQDT